jgi:DNA-binding MarR family transcriptional regulator
MKKTEPDIALHYYQALAEFRYQMRRFIRFSEQLARSKGIEPQQHQLLLAVKGLPDGKKATISELAERMQLQHHSVVELVDRLVDRSFVERQRDADDQRRVLVNLTSEGETILQQLSIVSLAELRQNGPPLVKALSDLLTQGGLIAPDETGDDAMN